MHNNNVNVYLARTQLPFIASKCYLTLLFLRLQLCIHSEMPNLLPKKPTHQIHSE